MGDAGEDAPLSATDAAHSTEDTPPPVLGGPAGHPGRPPDPLLATKDSSLPALTPPAKSASHVRVL